jgi:signal transduction histidine kinase
MSQSSCRILGIQVRNDGNDVRISISDTGCGISKADLPKIFMPFFTTKGQQGTGLGLYITRRVIDAHRGSVTVQSSPSGTTFTVCLPSRKLAPANCQCNSVGTAEHAGR